MPESLRVCSFESRRAQEMAALIRRHGGEATVAPSMQEVPLEENEAVFAFAEELLAGRIDGVLFLTGVGATTMMDICEQRYDREQMLSALRGVRTLVRGPKPAGVLQKWKVPISLRAPEPNTWQDLVAALDESSIPMTGQRIAVQEYGQPSEELYAALEDRSARVTAVPVYRWSLPDDTGPLEAAIQEEIDDPFDLILFTSAQQVQHVLDVAERLGRDRAWMEAVRSSVVASIGPTCSETLRELGLVVDFEPSHPRMGTLVREAMAAAPDRLQARRSS